MGVIFTRYFPRLNQFDEQVIGVEVVHGVEEVDEGEPEDVEDAQHCDDDVGADVALLAVGEGVGVAAEEGRDRGLEDGDGEHGGVAYREQVDEVLYFVFVEVAV